jgi:purine-binding chemotaxis protein CheW
MPPVPTRPGEKILEQARRAREHQLRPGAEPAAEQYLTVHLQGEWYALRADYLVEILPLRRITRVPSVPEHIVGVINFRGEILSVIDLKLFLALPQRELAPDPAIIVVEHDEIRTGLLVDGVGDLTPLSLRDVADESLGVGKARRGCFEGVGRLGESLVSAFNVGRLLQSEGTHAPTG